MIFQKPWRLYWGRMQKVCRREQSVASNNVGLMSMMIGVKETSRKRAMFYIWADGIYFNIRSDDAKQCILVIIGVTSRGG